MVANDMARLLLELETITLTLMPDADADADVTKLKLRFEEVTNNYNVARRTIEEMNKMEIIGVILNG